MKDNFLSSGAYGCVYHPPYDCQGNPVDDKKYVSKIVKSNFSTKTEYNIGKILQKEGFITIAKKCDITRDNLVQSKMRPNCKLFKKDPALEKKYLLLYSKYIKSEELSDFLKKNNTISLIMRSYFLLCERIDTLIATGIIHHDLHFGNVLYDNSQLYVIDFGLSLIKKMFYTKGQLDYEYLKKAVFKYSPSWNYWTLEYHFLCYLVHDGPLTKPVIEYTVNYYLSKNKVLQLFGSEFVNNYQQTALQYFMKYDGVSRDDAVSEMLNTSSTWDLYKIALHYIEIYKTTNMDIPGFLTVLMVMINPIPEFRPSPLEMKQFNQILLTTYTFENVKTEGQFSKQLTKRLSSSAF